MKKTKDNICFIMLLLKHLLESEGDLKFYTASEQHMIFNPAVYQIHELENLINKIEKTTKTVTKAQKMLREFK